jgi:hypothetical protein
MVEQAEQACVDLEQFRRDPAGFKQQVQDSSLAGVIVAAGVEYELAYATQLTRRQIMAKGRGAVKVTWEAFYRNPGYFLEQVRASGKPGHIISDGDLLFKVATPTRSRLEGFVMRVKTWYAHGSFAWFTAMVVALSLTNVLLLRIRVAFLVSLMVLGTLMVLTSIPHHPETCEGCVRLRARAGAKERFAEKVYNWRWPKRIAVWGIALWIFPQFLVQQPTIWFALGDFVVIPVIMFYGYALRVHVAMLGRSMYDGRPERR